MWSPSGSPVSWLGLAPALAQCLRAVSACCSMLEPAVPVDLLLRKRGTLASRAVTSGGFSEGLSSHATHLPEEELVLEKLGPGKGQCGLSPQGPSRVPGASVTSGPTSGPHPPVP